MRFLAVVTRLVLAAGLVTGAGAGGVLATSGGAGSDIADCGSCVVGFLLSADVHMIMHTMTAKAFRSAFPSQTPRAQISGQFCAGSGSTLREPASCGFGRGLPALISSMCWSNSGLAKNHSPC